MDIFGLYCKLLFSTSVIILQSSLCIQAKFSSVLITRNGKIVCSGSLTNTRTVLTAASCVEDGFRYEYRVLFNREQKYPAALESITINKNHKGRKNNIAQLHLRNPAMNGERLVRVQGRMATRLYDEKTQLEDIDCYIVDMKKDKMFKVEILSALHCSRKLGWSIDENLICTKQIGPLRKKCPTGAGNPIICKGHGTNWAQVGIHLDNTCSNKLMIATRISAYRQWLRINARNLIVESEENSEEPGENSNENEENKNGTTTDEPTGSTNTSENTGSNSNQTVICTDSEFKCSDGTCIPETEVCDGIVQCPSGPEDESSCGCDLAGTEFITAFFNNIGPAVSILYITAPDGANVTVTIPTLNYVETREIIQAEKWSIDDTSLIITELMSDKGVHISSDTPITVVAANSREVSYSTIDGTIVYPLTCLSNSYTVELQTHKFYKASQFAVIGVLPNTVVTTTSRQGTVKTITLGFLDVYFLQGRDLRGLTIQSTENVVVNSGSQCGYVPSNMTASCDHMVNQVPPNTNLDKSYIISPQKPRTSYLYRVRAAEDGTTIVIRDQSGTVTETATINKVTAFIRTVPDSSTYSIVSDKGIMVTQYSLDANLDGLGLGDPSMIILQSLHQFDTRYDFIIPDHMLRVGLTVTISTGHDVSGLRLNNKELDIFGMTTVDVTGVGEYYVINIDLSSKWAIEKYASLTHTDTNVSFGAMIYGIRVEGAFAWRIGGKI